MGTIAPTINDEEETADESDQAALIPRSVNTDGRYLMRNND
jgi:hypothetical protein